MCVKFIYLVMICISDEIKQSGIFLLCRLVSNKFKILYTAKNMGCHPVLITTGTEEKGYACDVI